MFSNVPSTHDQLLEIGAFVFSDKPWPKRLVPSGCTLYPDAKPENPDRCSPRLLELDDGPGYVWRRPIAEAEFRCRWWDLPVAWTCHCRGLAACPTGRQWSQQPQRPCGSQQHRCLCTWRPPWHIGPTDLVARTHGSPKRLAFAAQPPSKWCHSAWWCLQATNPPGVSIGHCSNPPEIWAMWCPWWSPPSPVSQSLPALVLSLEKRWSRAGYVSAAGQCRGKSCWHHSFQGCEWRLRRLAADCVARHEVARGCLEGHLVESRRAGSPAAWNPGMSKNKSLSGGAVSKCRERSLKQWKLP